MTTRNIIKNAFELTFYALMSVALGSFVIAVSLFVIFAVMDIAVGNAFGRYITNVSHLNGDEIITLTVRVFAWLLIITTAVVSVGSIGYNVLKNKIPKLK